MTTVLESLVSQIEADRKARRDAFQRLALDLLDGGNPDAGAVEAVTTSAGKSLDDLAAEIERLRERRALLATYLAGQNLEGAEQAAIAVMREADAELAAAQGLHREKCNGPQNSLAAIEDLRLQANLARTKLARTADPESLAAILRLNGAIVAFDEQIRELQLAVSHANQIAGPVTGITPLVSTPAIMDLEARRAAAMDELRAAEKLLETD
ncbi:MAG: hypothetical protein NTY19_24070 [Planctomycetota bacterium]|nr:hypothetical protein [Planctomycetota bacterium]